ncbi:MAG: sterol desaturase family protein [Acidimicrobiales bacterium]
MNVVHVLGLVLAFAVGFQLWILAEYLLHRFAMHHLHGRGIMSREHLLHHVAAGWTFSYIHPLSWAGMLLVGAIVWLPIGAALASFGVGVALALGWAVGYSFYEYQHAVAHLRPPTNRYERWVRKHHFHHHFGKPMANHGVTLPIWDRVFGTLEQPDRVRVPRRMAQPWMLDEDGELKADYVDDYVLVGSVDRDERLAQLDKARAFASVAPED